MSKPGLAFGLNLTKKPGASKPAPPKKKPMFGGDDSDDEQPDGASNVQEIGGVLGGFTGAASTDDSRKGPKSKHSIPLQPPKLKSKSQPNAMFGDLSSSLTSRKNAEAATELDSSVYEYDAVYDSLKPKKHETEADQERRPKYMRGVIQAAEVRKRDALIAEEKKIAREREAEGEEYADKEKFVTAAYRKQQEENRRIEEEEKRKAEEEEKKNQGGGMSAFYRKLLNRDEERHAEAIKAAERRAQEGPQPQQEEKEELPKEKSEADLAKELNEKGASIAVNEDGQVVDKRQLLRGGLNLGAKKKEVVKREQDRPTERERRHIDGAQIGRKQAMRERQSRMIAEQLEATLKRSREEEEAQRQEVERAAKSRKTEGEVSSARERYLARKKAAEEEKRKAAM
ncbi:coiled-coil domain-containing protein 55-domain containing protein [Stachybotrys elegans]|uniref:Coiled-coil domain-containing protein 55-domain containing protein n=1 Tax=Stachybotrys elegans TaxID=80388 RepID=A0A8K0WXI1_9HYPO|nr:coiled-coil domain-containing protein 55-domain containing protein [Stachybotrys elegans]